MLGLSSRETKVNNMIKKINNVGLEELHTMFEKSDIKAAFNDCLANARDYNVLLMLSKQVIQMEVLTSTT